MTLSLFEEIVSILEEYLGPAAKRFVSRQITFHLDKSPEELTPQDTVKLAEWIRVTLALLTEDRKIIDDSNRRILLLSETEVPTKW